MDYCPEYHVILFAVVPTPSSVRTVSCGSING